MKRIILLDIDGVLVQPGGYRAALRATVKRFIGDYVIEEELPVSMEKRGISSEWDMSPLIIAAYWEDVLSRQPMENLSDDPVLAGEQIQRQRKVEEPKHLSIPAFELMDGQYPVDAAYEQECFSSIPSELRKNLMTESRNVYKSQTFRTFQNFTLGSKTFEATYQLPADAKREAQSLLLTEDKANISAEVRERLRHERNSISGFTARPSKPPREWDGSHRGYAPEAELGLELAGLADIPLMSFGKLEFIAAQHGLNPATLMKPAPFHALAGILAAWTGDELAALNAAYEWHTSGKLNGKFSELPKSFELYVIEDTMGGVRATRAAGDILREAGFEVSVHTLGLTSGIAQKAEAFRKADVPFFENWESLIVGAGL
ncbi:MAG: hypothetical protein IPJ47_15280 [Anaerolineales bacterium]|nr:hypothetical protein [Anaerolineales bacterium]